ncbi:TPA: TIGR00725 family protein [Candidatus Nomurabacteria bacterium]|nr:MAG: Rossmann fold nucleotide-binding protein [Parcubacteria bacterium RAAC4_OD1_1]HCY26694.1 TIGR00725 family protein [Candidatus Nomurabacteria bacterium]
MKINRKLQIGVMGSAADLNYSKELENLAEQIGYFIAKNNATLIFGAEKDYDSLSTSACRGAKKAGGMTVGITYNRGLDIFEKENVDVVISTGLERGGGRETALIFSCDGIITISGGSGTLTEMAIAYQANMPIVAMKNTGGWSDKLANQYLDDRKRIKVQSVDTAEEAVKLILELANK